MSANNGQHEVKFWDKVTSKYETALVLLTAGYMALTMSLATKWFLTFTNIVPSNELLGKELEIAWIAWTAGLLGFTIGKNK